MKRPAFIYNPGAKGGRSEYRIKSLEKRIQALPQAELFHSEDKGDISDLVEELKPQFDVFVACGGDGTVQEVAAPIIKTDKILGIVPLGSGNDLCKTLGISDNIPDAFQTILNGSATAIDVGECNDTFFINTLGFGFDGLTNQYAQKLQAFPGFLRYAIAALKANFYHKQFEVEINNKQYSSSEKLIMLALANGRVEGGSFWIAPKASISDGKLEMVTIKPVSRFILPFLLPLLLIQKSDLIPQITSVKISSVNLKFSEKTAVHADGEVLVTDKKDFSIRVLPVALKVIC